jgi:hypothetical protein
MLSRERIYLCGIFRLGKDVFTLTKGYLLRTRIFLLGRYASVYCVDRLLALAKRYEASDTCEATRVGPRATENRARTRQDGPAARLRAGCSGTPLRKATARPSKRPATAQQRPKTDGCTDRTVRSLESARVRAPAGPTCSGPGLPAVSSWPSSGHTSDRSASAHRA